MTKRERMEAEKERLEAEKFAKKEKEEVKTNEKAEDVLVDENELQNNDIELKEENKEVEKELETTVGVSPIHGSSDINLDDFEEDEEDERLEEEKHDYKNYEFREEDRLIDENEVGKKEKLVERMEDTQKSKYLFNRNYLPIYKTLSFQIADILKQLNMMYGVRFMASADRKTAHNKCDIVTRSESKGAEVMDALDMKGRLPYVLLMELPFESYSREQRDLMNIARQDERDRVIDRAKIERAFKDILPEYLDTNGKPAYAIAHSYDKSAKIIKVYISMDKILPNLHPDIAHAVDAKNDFDISIVNVVSYQDKSVDYDELQVSIVDSRYNFTDSTRR